MSHPDLDRKTLAVSSSNDTFARIVEQRRCQRDACADVPPNPYDAYHFAPRPA